MYDMYPDWGPYTGGNTGNGDPRDAADFTPDDN